ncbi:MAG: ankyrin repeat domain-containing protein [Candidatus Babeliales bacterium]
MKHLVLSLIVLTGFFTTSNCMFNSRYECCGQLGLHTVSLQTLLKQRLDHDPIRGQLLVFGALRGDSDLVQEILLGVSDEKQKEVLKETFNNSIALLSFWVRQSINGNPRPYKETALMCATYNGHIEVVRLLIQNYVNLEITDYEGKTALDHAREYGWNEIAKLLEEEAEIQQLEALQPKKPW